MRLEDRIRELNLNFFNTDFEGIVVLTTKCLSCETITRQKQGMLDISVPVPISGYDTAELQEKPSAYIQVRAALIMHFISSRTNIPIPFPTELVHYA